MSAFHPISRRRLLQFALAGAAGVSALGAGADEAAMPILQQTVLQETNTERWLEMLNIHTGELLSLAYRDAAGFKPEALDQFNWLLRDFRVDEQRNMDALLFDQLGDLALAAGVEPRFEIISGYRSPRTNAALAVAGHGVATHSLHIEGKAIDIRLCGVGCDRLRDLALQMQRGGVGYYRNSDFVHVDTGHVRSWDG